MKQNQILGLFLIVIGGGIGVFAYAHRPLEGFGDMLNRANSWVFNPAPYYALLVLASLICLVGVMRLAKNEKPPARFD